MRKAPATPAVAIESPKASSFTRTGFTPIRRNASWSWATASTACPPGDVAVARAHHAVVHAEDEDQRNLGDEENPEEERKASQRLLPALLEAEVIDAVQRHPEQEEQRRERERNGDRIEAEAVVDDVGDVGAQDDERR